MNDALIQFVGLGFALGLLLTGFRLLVIRH